MNEQTQEPLITLMARHIVITQDSLDRLLIDLQRINESLKKVNEALEKTNKQ